jgi:hypothetical protein
MVCKETMVARLECEMPTSVDMESEAEHREVPNEYAVVKPVRGRKSGIGAESKLQGGAENQRN